MRSCSPTGRYRSAAPSWAAILLVFAAGCARPGGGPPGGAPPPEVAVSLPIAREVTDYEDFPGRTEAVQSVDVRSRVTGYLTKIHFRDGDPVKEGDVLFDIDSRPYDAELAQAEANLAQATAHEARLKADLGRAGLLLAKRALSREDFDKFEGDYREAVAAVGVAQASRDKARLNVEFTKIKSPVTGRVSRRYLDVGNLVKADDTILTNIVTVGEIYASFDVDERATLRIQKLIRDGKLSFYPGAPPLPVWLGLADEKGFSEKGRIDFTDNHVDSDTGTWRMRGRFANPNGALSSGLFVHIRLPIGEPYRALLIAEKAVASDQAERFVYVVGDDNVARARPVTLGKRHDGLQVVAKGIGPQDKVVVEGLQRVRPNAPVVPKLVPMPEQKPADAAADAAGKKSSQ